MIDGTINNLTMTHNETINLTLNYIESNIESSNAVQCHMCDDEIDEVIKNSNDDIQLHDKE